MTETTVHVDRVLGPQHTSFFSTTGDGRNRELEAPGKKLREAFGLQLYKCPADLHFS